MNAHIVIRALVAALAATATAPAQDPNPFRPFDRAAFEAHARSLGADDAAMERFAQDAGEVSVAVAVDELLQRLVPAYGEAVQLAQDGDPKAALALTGHVTSDDLHVRAHARYYLGRVFLDADDPEAAVEILADYLSHDRNLTPLDPEAAFFYASALADIPLPGHAIQAFDDYLILFPDAPERYRAVAMQRRAEIESQLDNSLHNIADVMKGVERDIKKARTGDPTQERQKDIVEKLLVIIEELEKQEQQSSGSPSGNSQSASPAANSALPTGASRVGTLKRVPGVGDRWGNMKDRERQEIEAEVQARLPPRYRELLKDYYDRLGRSSGSTRTRGR